MYPLSRNFDVYSTASFILGMTDLNANNQIIGPNVNSGTFGSGNWTTPPLDCEQTEWLSIQCAYSGSTSGTLNLQLTCDPGFTPGFGQPGTGKMTASSSIGAPLGNFYNWSTVAQVPVPNSDSTPVFLQYNEVSARACRVTFTANTNSSGSYLCSVTGKGIFR